MTPVVGALGRCELRRAFEQAQHVPFAATSTVSVFNEKLQVDLSSRYDLFALRARGVSPMNSLLVPIAGSANFD